MYYAKGGSTVASLREKQGWVSEIYTVKGVNMNLSGRVGRRDGSCSHCEGGKIRICH